jgi:hypothetical protein
LWRFSRTKKKFEREFEREREFVSYLLSQNDHEREFEREYHPPFWGVSYIIDTPSSHGPILYKKSYIITTSLARNGSVWRE